MRLEMSTRQACQTVRQISKDHILALKGSSVPAAILGTKSNSGVQVVKVRDIEPFHRMSAPGHAEFMILHSKYQVTISWNSPMPDVTTLCDPSPRRTIFWSLMNIYKYD